MQYLSPTGRLHRSLQSLYNKFSVMAYVYLLYNQIKVKFTLSMAFHDELSVQSRSSKDSKKNF